MMSSMPPFGFIFFSAVFNSSMLNGWLPGWSGSGLAASYFLFVVKLRLLSASVNVSLRSGGQMRQLSVCLCGRLGLL